MKTTLFNKGAHNAFRPDSFYPSFFQHNWSSLSSDLLRLVQGIFSGRDSIRGVNGTFINLISKVNVP